MSLNVPSVVIDDDPYKYILAKIVDVAGDECFVVRARQKEGFAFHKNILAALRTEPRVKDATCVGGGRIAIDHEHMTIRVGDTSSDFGEPDYRLVREVLEANFPGFFVETPE